MGSEMCIRDRPTSKSEPKSPNGEVTKVTVNGKDYEVVIHTDS